MIFQVELARHSITSYFHSFLSIIIVIVHVSCIQYPQSTEFLYVLASRPGFLLPIVDFQSNTSLINSLFAMVAVSTKFAPLFFMNSYAFGIYPMEMEIFHTILYQLHLLLYYFNKCISQNLYVAVICIRVYTPSIFF